MAASAYVIHVFHGISQHQGVLWIQLTHFVHLGEPEGSRFIQAFCEVMKRDGRRVEATMIFAIATRLMSYTPGTSMPDKSLPHPCVISQLKKGLYFS